MTDSETTVALEFHDHEDRYSLWHYDIHIY
jgi:uncharacterized protein YbdZ (MbtH family)